MGQALRADDRRNAFGFARKHDAIAAEAALDGIYIIRTSVSAAQMDASECVRIYKALAEVERALRSLKTARLKARPIHHRLETRVRAHIFLCMLAYYVEWHMREAWRELMFADTDNQAKPTGAIRWHRPSDPGRHWSKSPAARWRTVRRYMTSRLAQRTGDLVRNTCRAPNADTATFTILTTPNAHQRRALDLLQRIGL